jgi:hypothetical protein
VRVTWIESYGRYSGGGTALLTFAPLYFVGVDVVSSDVAIERRASENFCIRIETEVGDCVTVLLKMLDLDTERGKKLIRFSERWR